MFVQPGCAPRADAHRHPAAGEVLLAHEVAVGESYRLVLTTATGLRRCETNDHVEVVDRYGRAPVLRLTRR